MKVYCFGNEFLKEDSLAKEIAGELEITGIEFINCESPEDIFQEKGDIVILDVIEGIDKVIIIEDMDQLKDNNITTLHDFDLSFFLKLMKSMDQIGNVRIIGIPIKGDKKIIKKQILKILQPVNL
ncbi:MAG: hypothetical protein ABIC04_06245 [Nanoarchaeota archaeon]